MRTDLHDWVDSSFFQLPTGVERELLPKGVVLELKPQMWKSLLGKPQMGKPQMWMPQMGEPQMGEP